MEESAGYDSRGWRDRLLAGAVAVRRHDRNSYFPGRIPSERLCLPKRVGGQTHILDRT